MAIKCRKLKANNVNYQKIIILLLTPKAKKLYMNNKYIKILKEIQVYSEPNLGSTKIKTLSNGEFASFNREKKRNGIVWLQIFIKNKEIGYIKKIKNTYFECRYVSLKDEKVIGFNYIVKGEIKKAKSSLFFPYGLLDRKSNDVGDIKLETIKNSQENKKYNFNLEYKKNLIDLNSIIFYRDENFYITDLFILGDQRLIEVNNLNGKQAFILKQTHTSKLEDRIIYNIAITFSIFTATIWVIAMLIEGSRVFKGMVIIIGIILSVTSFFLIKLLVMSFKKLYFNLIKYF